MALVFNEPHSGVKVTHVSCGARHTLALCEGAEVFSWGDATYGQLGYSTDQKLSHTPNRISVLEGVPVIQVRWEGLLHPYIHTLLFR